MKRVVFIGNRVNVLKNIVEATDDFVLTKIFALKDSFVHKYLETQNLEYELFGIDNESKTHIFNFLLEENYDLLISNGCPFILPIEKIKKNKPSIIALNIHPTYLPYLSGKTPLNGVFMLDYNFIGATVHYISEGIDNGDIRYQKKIKITKDIDQGLIYMISFDLEGEIFRRALHKLTSNNFNYVGHKQIGKGSYFNRDTEIFKIDFDSDTTDTIVKKVNSVGMINLGVKINIDNQIYTLHNAEPIINHYILNKYRDSKTGILLYKYSDKLLIKTKDGIIKCAFI